jgi:hypothetical protein
MGVARNEHRPGCGRQREEIVEASDAAFQQPERRLSSFTSRFRYLGVAARWSNRHDRGEATDFPLTSGGTMKQRAARIVSGTLAVGSLAYGASLAYLAATNNGDPDELPLLCKIAILIWSIFALLIILAWGRCRSGCENSPFPDGCRSECDALWGGLLLVETVVLALVCGQIHFP